MRNTQIPLTELLTALQRLKEREGLDTTLLCIGTMSEQMIRAALELSKDMDFPAMLIASRNQVDAQELGGGYLYGGCDQQTFVDSAKRIAGEVGFSGPLSFCRDHGGPWQRHNERKAMLSEKDAMDRAKRSYLSDILAGFNVFHIDTSVDPCIEGCIPQDVILRRTIELLDYIENERQKNNLAPVGYEVGTEETAGDLTDFGSFEGFLSALVAELDRRDLPKPDFVVGQTGTLIRMTRNVGHFDAQMARQLASIARNYGVGFKEHHGDFLSQDILALHPELGITGVCTGPGFSVAEMQAYFELAGKEEYILEGRTSMSPSEFASLVETAALESGGWKRWLTKEEAHLTKYDIMKDKDKMREIALICGRYALDNPRVDKARRKLFVNLQDAGLVDDPDRRIIEDIKASMQRWVDAFNLTGVTSRVLGELQRASGELARKEV